MHFFRVHCFLLLFIVLARPMTALGQDFVTLNKVVKSILRDRHLFDSTKTNGIVIGVIDGDSVWTFGFGRLAADDATRPDAQTAFEVAGLSKVMIGVALQNLQMTEKINAFLPPKRRFAAGEKITLLQLFTHRSGLPRLPTNIGATEEDRTQPYQNYRFTDFKNYLDSLDVAKLDTGKYQISHLNYELLSYINHCWDSLAPSFMAKAKNVATGYDRAQKSVPTWQYGETFRHISVVTTLEKILEMLKKMPNDARKNGIFATNIDPQTFVGVGWHLLQPRKNVWVQLSTGATGGFSTFIGQRTDTQTSVVVLSNARQSVTAIGYYLLQSINDNWKRKPINTHGKK
jgi:serine-type D-Ala-D-Ala carboxypeptidase/endopeptidase